MGWFSASSSASAASSASSAPAAKAAKESIDAAHDLATDTHFDEESLANARAYFRQYASIRKDGETYMNIKDFARAMTPLTEGQKPKREQGISVLFKVADRRKRDLISESDFVSFQNVVRGPNAEFEVAFRLFDTNGDGKVTFDQFKQILSSIQGTESVATDFNSEWFTLFVGKKPRDISYEEFAQLLKGYQAERLKQEFKHYDSKGSGHIDPQAFRQIMLHVAKHKLSPFVTEHLPSLSQLYPGDNISFANLRACYNVIRQMDMVERITRKAAALTKDSCVSKADFKAAAAQMMRFNMLTPMEVDIFFHLAGRDFDTETTRLPIAAFERLFDPNYNASDPQAIRDHASAFVATNSDVTDLARQVVQLSAAMEALKSIYNFTLGAIAGAIGATVVYPIDLVKTRMQNQRASATSQLLYKNSIDCFQKVIKREGVMGLYSGLLPQLVGVAPEKAIKLTMNDLVRSHLRDKRTGEITLAGEILAGCTAGGSQVLFTNPLEIVKIRLQVQGEAAKTAAEATPRYSALQIVRQLGLLGLYRGVGACLLRDIPFSAIYFPTYAHLKKGLFDEGVEGKRLGAFELLTAGAIAGMPAAYLVTPADVIKTRLQVAARKGETTYTGITDAFRKILREEGPRAFFKGGLARVFRSSPQFGVTLASYEFLHRLFPVDFGDQRTEMVVRKARSTASGGGGDGEANVQTRGGFADTGARNALRVLNEINPELVASVGTRA